VEPRTLLAMLALVAVAVLSGALLLRAERDKAIVAPHRASATTCARRA
jgi:hypothetical protein